MLRADLPPPIARDRSNRQCLDFHPLASDQMHHRSIPTHHLFLRSRRRLLRFLLEPLHLRIPHRERCLPCRQRRSARRGFAHAHPEQVLKSTPALTRRASRSTVAPAFPPHAVSILHSRVLTLHPGGKKPTPHAGQVP